MTFATRKTTRHPAAFGFTFSSSLTSSQYKSILKTGTALCGAAMLAALPHAAAAQTEAPATGSGAIEEIVVTAQRVESTAQTTPIAMDVYGGNELKNQSINTVSQLQQISPSVNVSSDRGTVVTIRGISSRDTTEIGDPAVVVAVDNFYQDRSYALGLSQYDIDRVEVLRGPQGTLYGRNATGGAINIYSARPGRDVGGYVQVEGGNYSTLNTEGAVNMPLSDMVQMRASFGTQYHEGYRTTPPYGNADDANARSGRLQFRLRPVENLTIDLLAQHTVQTAIGSKAQIIPYRVDAQGFVIHDRPALLDPQYYPSYEDGRLNLNDTVFKWNATYESPFATIMYLGGYDRLKWDSLSPGMYDYAPATAANPNPRSQVRVYNQREKPITTNHELRLISPDQDARFTWQAGVFYFKNHNELDSFNYSPNGTPNPTPVIHFNYDVTIKSLAEMAYVGFKVTEQLKLSAGFRHNDDDKQRTGYIFFSQARPPGATPTSLSTTIKKNTVHVGADYQVTDRNLVYAKYDTGYKSGGFTDVAPYGPETVKTWEVGSKNRFWDNRLQFNIDAYYSKYSGQQVQQIVQGVTTGGLRIVNAGETRIWGVEADAIASTDAGRFELNVAYLDAEFTDFLLATGVPRFNSTTNSWSSTNVNLQLKGNRPQQAPKWTINGAYQYTVEDFMGGALTGRIQARYQSKQYYTFFNRPDDTQKANVITNVLLTYAPYEARWQLQGYVRNLTNEAVFSNAGPNDRNFNYTYSYQPPRTYGIQVRYAW